MRPRGFSVLSAVLGLRLGLGLGLGLGVGLGLRAAVEERGTASSRHPHPLTAMS